jgi:hypothetical protein
MVGLMPARPRQASQEAEHEFELYEGHGQDASLYQAGCSVCGWVGDDHVAKEGTHERAKRGCREDFEDHVAGRRKPWQMAPGERRVWRPQGER